MHVRVLLIEDDPDVVEMLTGYFKKHSEFTIVAERDGAAGLRHARNQTPAAIILDLMLPKMPGLEVCRSLKTDPATRNIPILMLTAKAEEVDRIVGLEFGADDYVTKPFSPREVMLRIRAILKRVASPSDGTPANITAGAITIEPAQHRVTVSGKALDLTATEFKLLSTLAQRRGRVQGRDRLLSDVWGYESIIDTRTVDTHVRRLREKLGKSGGVIETVRGFGYRFRADQG
jgi:two-component system phosphate regulon response regulator PhoB